MLEKFRSWYLRNYLEITWFLIGFLAMDALVQFGKGNWIGALFSAALAALNYAFVRKGW